MTERFYDEMDAYRTSDEFSEAERAAIEYAERFARDHRAIDDELFGRLQVAFDDAEILDLTFCIARHLAFGRMTQVLGLDVSCPVVFN